MAIRIYHAGPLALLMAIATVAPGQQAALRKEIKADFDPTALFALSRNGRVLAAANARDRAIVVWDTTSGKETVLLKDRPEHWYELRARSYRARCEDTGGAQL